MRSTMGSRINGIVDHVDAFIVFILVREIVLIGVVVVLVHVWFLACRDIDGLVGRELLDWFSGLHALCWAHRFVVGAGLALEHGLAQEVVLEDLTGSFIHDLALAELAVAVGNP